MAAKDADQRRQKRLAKHKKRREHRSRPGKDQPRNTPEVSLSDAAGWPHGPCFLSEGWHEPGATVTAILSRAFDEVALCVTFAVDLGTAPSVTKQRVDPVPLEQVPGVVARASHTQGVELHEVSPAQAAAVLAAAGPSSEPAVAWALARAEPERAPIEVRTGAPEPPPPPKPEGWFSRLVGKLVGSP